MYLEEPTGRPWLINFIPQLILELIIETKSNAKIS
jgi:hypothetical protein